MTLSHHNVAMSGGGRSAASLSVGRPAKLCRHRRRQHDLHGGAVGRNAAEEIARG